LRRKIDRLRAERRTRASAIPCAAALQQQATFLLRWQHWNFYPVPTFSLRLERSEENNMLGTILIIILILLLIGALPTWPYSTGWGYYPGGGLGLVLIVVVILVLIGRI
jgi:uncharacterized protein DUF3309